jgi:hypothetical protein
MGEACPVTEIEPKTPAFIAVAAKTAVNGHALKVRTRSERHAARCLERRAYSSTIREQRCDADRFKLVEIAVVAYQNQANV